jgi:hypothetical protein
MAMRILIGSAEVAGQINDLADGFRALGHTATTVIKERKHQFFTHHNYDVDLSHTAPDLIPWPASVARAKSFWIRGPRGAANRLASYGRLLALIAQHDVFVFVRGGISLTLGNREYPLLKALGKKLIAFTAGPDVCYVPAYQQQFGTLGSPEFCAAHQAMWESAEGPFATFLNTRTMEVHADAIFSAPNAAVLAVRPYRHFYLAMKLANYRFEVPGREVPVVVHAPSFTAIKGTPAILRAVDRLRAEGVAFEFRLLQKVPNQRIVQELAEADVVVDQLFFPLHGRLGAEAMASGCALATCNREDYEPVPTNRPIWHLDEANVFSALKQLLTDRALRVRLAYQGRQHVERYHDHVKVAQRALESLDPSRAPDYDHYPTFFTRRFVLPAGVSLPLPIRRMTARVIRRWGLPEGIDSADLCRRGLMADNEAASGQTPRWNCRATRLASV